MASVKLLTGLLLLTCAAVSLARHNRRRGGYRHHPHHVHAHDHYHDHDHDRTRGRRGGHVCYPGIGCFDGVYPFNNTGELPQDPDFVNTVFRLYTRQRLTNPDILVVSNRQSLIQSSFNHNLPEKILIHGFLATSRVEWIRNVTTEFLRKGPMNVITVDWGAGAGFPYAQAASNTRLVAAQLANLITFLTHETGNSPNSYHLIGHSLGAHICGYTGHRVPGIGRITGLDPAQPNFQGKPPMVRLDPTDANFVDVIHTDGSAFETLGGFGMIDPVGHLDFYPNGGVQQPGCPQDGWSSFVSSAYSHGVEDAEFTVGCNHNRATELFSESINSRCPFTAYPCSDFIEFSSGHCFSCGHRPCPSMGYSASGSASTGSYYLMTNPNSPFCGYHYEVKIQLGNEMHRVRGAMHVRLHGSRGRTDIVHLHNDVFIPGEELTVVFVSASDISDVEDVHVTFNRVYNYLDYFGFWNTDTGVQIQRLTTYTANNNIRKVFCPMEAIIRSGSGIWLTHGETEDRSSC